MVGTNGEVLAPMLPAPSEGHANIERALSGVLLTRLEVLGAQGCPAFMATDDVGRDEKWSTSLLESIFPAAMVADPARIAQDVVHR